jgi:hypothetical protein
VNVRSNVPNFDGIRNIPPSLILEIVLKQILRKLYRLAVCLLFISATSADPMAVFVPSPSHKLLPLSFFFNVGIIWQACNMYVITERSALPVIAVSGAALRSGVRLCLAIAMSGVRPKQIPRLESQPEYWLSWLRVFVIFFSCFRQIKCRIVPRSEESG